MVTHWDKKNGSVPRSGWRTAKISYWLLPFSVAG
jgi:hypothetical protein